MNDEERLAQAMQNISHNFKKVIAEFQKQSSCDLSLHDCRVIEYIGENAYTLNEIASFFQVTPGTMSVHIERMVEDGMLSREQDKKDRRKTIIKLSSKGLNYYRMLHEKLMEFSKKALEVTSTDEREKIIEIFEKMARIDLK